MSGKVTFGIDTPGMVIFGIVVPIGLQFACPFPDIEVD